MCVIDLPCFITHPFAALPGLRAPCPWPALPYQQSLQDTGWCFLLRVELQQLHPTLTLHLSLTPPPELGGLIRLIKVSVWIERVKEHPSVLDLLLLQWRQEGQELVSGSVQFSLLAADRSTDEVIMN